MSIPGEQTQAALKAEIERLQAEIKYLKAASRQKLIARDALIHNLYHSSTSWQAARPLRAIKKAINLILRNEAPPKKNETLANKSEALLKETRICSETIPETLEEKTNNNRVWQKVSEAEALKLLSESPLFDANWYRNQYPDVAKSALEPALHYIRRGGAAKRKPSIYFDTVYYLDQNPSVVTSGIPPLVHYLKYGQAEGKKPLALLEPVQPEGPRPLHNPNMPIVASPGVELGRVVPWVRHSDLAADDNNGLFYGDIFLARLPPVEMAPDIVAPLVNFCRLMDLNADSHVRLRVPGDQSIDDKAALRAAIMPSRYRGLGPTFLTGSSCIADAWFANDLTLRMRFGEGGIGAPDTGLYVVRAFQADAAVAEKIALIGENILLEEGPALVDLNLLSPLLPVLLILSTPDGTLVDMGILPFPSLCRGGMHHAELSWLSARGSPKEDLWLISDALMQEYIGQDNEAPRSIQQIAVGLEEATGAERIFSDLVLEWLVRVFRLRVVPNMDQSSASYHGAKHLRDHLHAGGNIRPPLLDRVKEGIKEGSTLLLSPEALPTISVLASRRLCSPHSPANAAGSFLVADSITCRPRWSVVLPPMDEDLLILQPSGSSTRYPILIPSEVRAFDEQHGIGRNMADLPLAIHFRCDTSPDEAVMLMSLAPDAAKPVLRRTLTQIERTQASVTAIIRCASVRGTKRLIQSLAQQTLYDNIDVIAIIQTDLDDGSNALRSDLERLFAGRHDIVPSSGNRCTDFSKVADAVHSCFTLFVDDTIVLHDTRTIETLVTLAHGDAVASASCVILHEPMIQKRNVVRYQSGGFFPSHVSFQSAPHLIFNQPNWLEVFADATYPVVGNSFELSLVRTDILRQFWTADLGVFSEAYEDLRFALDTLASGHKHLCTSAVRATSFAGSRLQERMDPIGRNSIKPSQWEHLLSSVTFLRELR
jgi:hypothetical protein